MSATPLLSLCCGARPAHGECGQRRTTGGLYTGYCSCCGHHAPFAPGGVREEVWLQPKRLSDAERERLRLCIERDDSLTRLFWVWVAAIAMVFVFWLAWTQSSQRGAQSTGQEGVGGGRGGAVHVSERSSQNGSRQ